jgi:sulfur-oxidizing protein SoxB
MDVDLKLARACAASTRSSAVTRTTACPRRRSSTTRAARTLVTNAGSSGKFLAVLDLDVRGGKVADYRYKLLPVFANLLPADAAMAAHIEASRAPFRDKLGEKLAVTEGLLYRRGNFNGTADQLILDALMAEMNAEIAFSPGFRWGTTLLPGDAITFEHLLDQTAITYPYATRQRAHRRDDQDDPRGRRRQPVQSRSVLSAGGDMVRVGGLRYAIAPNAAMGSRITRMTLHERPIDADRKYKVAGWAPVSEKRARRARRRSGT